MVYALIAALLFGAGIPISKALGVSWPEIPLAGTLYLSSGIVLLVGRFVVRGGKSLGRAHLPWFAGAVLLGGGIAPIALLYGLRFTTGYAGSLLINLEAVFTGLIAVVLFRERLRRSEWLALAILLAGALIVTAATAQEQAAPRPILGGILVTLAGACWAFDNNFTRHISECDPLQIGGVKGIVAGTINLLLGFALGHHPPLAVQPLALASLVGLFSYGLSLVFFVLALRRRGATRTAAVFSTLTLVSGVLASWLILGEKPPVSALGGGAIIMVGILALAAASRPVTQTNPTDAPSQTAPPSPPA